MKKLRFLLFLGLTAFLIFPFSTRAEKLADRLHGRILLQVESKGEAWYVDPNSKQRAFLGRPDDIFQVMRNFGLGIKQTELQSYLDSQFPKRLAGRILLNVEGRGEAYYISPDDLRGNYLGSPQQAFRVVREKAIGITNENIDQINVVSTPATKVSDKEEPKQTTTTDNPVQTPLVPVDTQNTPVQTPPAVVTPNTNHNTSGGPGACTSWTYSAWNTCSNGTQTREVISALPAGCSGGSPEVSKPCVVGACTSWYYTVWGNCTNGAQFRQITESFPAGCSGGQPTLIKSCSSSVQCTAWTYSDWSPCTNGTQTRTTLSGTPDGCEGGQPILSQTCDNTSSSQYSPYQFSYAREMGPLYDPHVRIVFLGQPNSNIKILKIPVSGYYGYGTPNDTLPSDLSYSVNYIQGGEQKSVIMNRLNNRDFLFEAGEPIPLDLGDNNSVTIKANKDHYSAINNISNWVIWDYSVDKPVWTRN